MPAYRRTAATLLLGAIALGGCQNPPVLAVTNWTSNSVTEYSLTANGNAAPSVTLAGDDTGIDFPVGIASDSVGSLRIGNGLGGFQGIGGSITSYVKGASGNSSPIATIAGANTGLTDAVASGGLSSVAVDAAGNIYVASTWDLTVYARGATGDVAPIATIAGSKTELFNLNGIAVDGAGKIYAANYDGPAPSITVYAPGANGNVAPVAKVSGPRTGLQPQALAVDANGTVYVANVVAALASVTVYPPGANGNVSPQRLVSGSNTGLFNPNGIAVDAQGDVYVSNAGLGRPDAIIVFGPGANGNVAPRAIITGSQTGLNYPGAMTIVNQVR